MAREYLSQGRHPPTGIPVLHKWRNMGASTRSRLSVAFLLFILLSVLVPQCPAAQAQEQVLVVGAADNFPPYEYADSGGVPRGYTIDLIKAVAEQEHLNIRIVSGPWTDIRRQFDDGEIDILSGMMYLTRVLPFIDFSVAHSSATYAIFVRKDSPHLHTDLDLRKRTVWVQQGDISFNRLAQNGVYVRQAADVRTALAKLAEGQGDAVLAARSVGAYQIQQLGIHNVQISEDNYEQHILCFAVRRGRRDQLLDKLNEGLTRLKYNGVQQQLEDKWLSPWEPHGVSLRKLLTALGSLAGLLFAVFAWSWTLRKKVRQRTAELQRELAQRLEAEARIGKINRLYAVTNEINKAIVRIRDREMLFLEVCRLVVEHGGFPLAWIGRVDEAAHRVFPVARWGTESEHLRGIEFSTLEESPEGYSPVGIAIREGRIATGHDVTLEACIEPGHSRALADRLRSSAALPLRVDTKIVATFSLYAAEPGFFDDAEELSLLDGVARDISFALEAIEHEQRREYAEHALQESEERFRTAFEQAAVGIALCDADTRILAANSALCEMLGYSREELIGREMLSPDLTYPDDMEVSRHFARKLLSGEISRGTGEKRYLCKDGHTIWTQLVAAVVRDTEGTPLYFINQIQDITAARAAEEKLHEAYEDMESIFRASPAAIVTLDEDLNVRAWNSSAERMFGWAAKDVLGRKLPLVRPDDWNQAMEYHERTLQGLPVSNEEVKVLRRDGVELDVSVSSSPVRDAAGRYTGGVLAFTDITERKRSEEKLREAYETMDAVVRASPLAIMTLEDHKYVTLWNQAAERMYGWKAEEVIGRPNPGVPPEEMADYDKLREALLRGEVVAGKETKGIRKDGTRIDILYSTAPMRDKQGRFTRGVGMMWDITDRKRAEQELREANATKDTILRASPVALLAHDLQGNMILWNDAAERMFGWTAEEIMGRPLPIIPPGQLEEFHERRARVLEGEEISNLEMKRLRKDGTLLDVSFSITPFRDAEGRLIGALGAYLDVTERKRLEAQLLQSQKLESVGRLAGGIAHDFNNLLTVINCHSDLLLERVPPGPVSNALQEIRKAGEQASSLTRQLLAFSRRQMLQSRVLDLNAVVRDISGMLERLLGEDIELIIELASTPSRVKVDPGQFQQVIMNLAVNARDAMPKGGRLTITTAILEELPIRSGDGDNINTPQIMLAVSDTGCGMDEETQHHMFEPFFTTKPPGKGTGLGLSMVWGIVKQSGGHLWVQSELGKGTTFTLLLPRVEEPVAAGELRPRRAVTLHGSETILLVEDQPQLRELTSHILTGYGYRVLEAANGMEALRIVGQDGTAIDLVLTDIVMPGMTGIEMGKRIRDMRPGLKLLYMSGYTDDVILQQGEFEAGAAYIEKPFTPEGLGTKIRHVLGVSATGTESAA